MSSDAADEGVHALEMRFEREFCGTRIKNRTSGDMVESVDALDSKSGGREVVWVRVPLSPPTEFAFVMELVDIPD